MTQTKNIFVNETWEPNTSLSTKGGTTTKRTTREEKLGGLRPQDTSFGSTLDQLAQRQPTQTESADSSIQNLPKTTTKKNKNRRNPGNHNLHRGTLGRGEEPLTRNSQSSDPELLNQFKTHIKLSGSI